MHIERRTLQCFLSSALNLLRARECAVADVAAVVSLVRTRVMPFMDILRDEAAALQTPLIAVVLEVLSTGAVEAQAQARVIVTTWCEDGRGYKLAVDAALKHVVRRRRCKLCRRLRFPPRLAPPAGTS